MKTKDPRKLVDALLEVADNAPPATQEVEGAEDAEGESVILPQKEGESMTDFVSRRMRYIHKHDS